MAGDIDNRWDDDNYVDDIMKRMSSVKRDRAIPHDIMHEGPEPEHILSDMSNMNDIDDIDNRWPDENVQHSQQKNIENIEKSENLEKEEPVIIKSDTLLDIKYILEEISSGIKEIEGFKTYIHDEKGKDAIERGRAHIYKYRNYYDVTTAIKTAGLVNPNDFDSPVYNKERIFEDLERYADIVNVVNDGTENLFVIISHGGKTNFSQEATIFPGEVKTYYYVYELRLRSPEKGLPYRVTEYNIMDVSQTSGIPIEKAVLQDVDLPGTGEDWLDQDLTPTRFPTTFRVQISTSIDGNFEAAIKRDGNTQVVFFNATSGPALLADGLYVFELLVHKEDKINFRFSETGGTIKILRVQEIDTATS